MPIWSLLNPFHTRTEAENLLIEIKKSRSKVAATVRKTEKYKKKSERQIQKYQKTYTQMNKIKAHDAEKGIEMPAKQSDLLRKVTEGINQHTNLLNNFSIIAATFKEFDQVFIACQTLIKTEASFKQKADPKELQKIIAAFNQAQTDYQAAVAAINASRLVVVD